MSLPLYFFCFIFRLIHFLILDAVMRHLNSSHVAESDHAILQMSKHEDAKTNQEIVEKGAIPRLVDLLCQIETHEKTKERIASILANLALCGKESKREIAERGGIPPLVELLSVGSAESRKNALCALMNVLVEDENISFCDEKLVESLVELLKGEDAEMRKHAAGTLANIATDKEKREQIVAKKAVPALIDVLKTGDAYAKGVYRS
jgi:HEAT repeat protein